MTALPAELTLHHADSFTAIPSETFYRIARLRQEVFVVEQACAYLDLDGRDLEPGTVQMWAEAEDGQIVSTLRILHDDSQEPGLRTIGRVATAADWRGKGIAAEMLRHAIRLCEGNPVMLYAQSYLSEWYTRQGFDKCGDEFVEDGIPHLPMRLRSSAKK